MYAIGVPRTLSVMFCPCESDVVKLIKLNYWPATPTRPSIAFSFSLLDWLEALLLKCQVALHDATDRKKAAGSSVHGPLNAGIVFDDQSQVNTFIDNYKPKTDATEKV